MSVAGRWPSSSRTRSESSGLERGGCGAAALASEVQQQLFPPRARQRRLDCGFCQPAREVGATTKTSCARQRTDRVAVADVSGKGISAALLMSTVQASLRSQAMALNPGLGIEGSLADLVGTMNRLLWRSTGAASHVTFFYAQFDERARRLTYVNAGHNPPLLVRAVGAGGPHAGRENGKNIVRANGIKEYDGGPEGGVALTSDSDEDVLWPGSESSMKSADRARVLRLSVGGPVLGVLEDGFYCQETIEMRAGDILVAFTDGLTEALNAPAKSSARRVCRRWLSQRATSRRRRARRNHRRGANGRGACRSMMI